MCSFSILFFFFTFHSGAHLIGLISCRGHLFPCFLISLFRICSFFIPSLSLFFSAYLCFRSPIGVFAMAPSSPFPRICSLSHLCHAVLAFTCVPQGSFRTFTHIRILPYFYTRSSPHVRAFRTAPFPHRTVPSDMFRTVPCFFTCVPYTAESIPLAPLLAL